MAFDNKAPQKARVNRTQGFKKGFAKTKEGAKKEFSKNKGFEKKTEKKDFLENAKRAFKARNYDKKAPRDEASFKHQDEHVEFVRRKGFSPFQLRLVNSILEDVLVMHNSLDRAYAYWFNKVKIDPVEQGFLIRQINFMFSRLSLFAFVSNLKRPSDFERHVGRLTFSYWLL